MKKSIFTILSCALLAAPAMMAEEAVANEANAAQPVAEAVAEPAAEPQCDLGDLLKKMPVKLSGYLQTVGTSWQTKTAPKILPHSKQSACA